MSITKESPSQASIQSASSVLNSSNSAELPRGDRRRIQQAVAAILLVLSLLVVARLWCLEGLLFPVSIEGASMADTFVGVHYQVKCADCGHEFRCDGQRVPATMTAACPNCGYADNKLHPADYRPGEQVLVDRWVYLLGRPHRGDIVAIADPDDNAQRVVKRIVGLPGEHIAIRHGDIIVDGQPAAKSLRELKSQATLVNDSRQPPRKSTDVPARWQPAEMDTYWVEENGTHFYRAHLSKQTKVKVQEGFDWLSFRYIRRIDRPMPHVEYSPVLDDDAYNQDVNRNLNDVSDLLLTCRATVAKYGCLVFAAIDREDRFEVHLCHDERKLKVYQNGEILKEELLPHRNHDEPIDIEFALCDQRVLFGMDGRQVLAQAYQRTNPEAAQVDPQLQIGGAGARIRISNARVYRDVYYLHPNNTNENWHAERKLPANCYLLLGDNPPVSEDSRQWPQEGVPLSAIHGRVIKPWWTSR